MTDKESAFLDELSDRDAEAMLTTLLGEAGEFDPRELTAADVEAALQVLPRDEIGEGMALGRGDVMRLSLKLLRDHREDFQRTLSKPELARDLLRSAASKERARAFSGDYMQTAALVVVVLEVLKVVRIEYQGKKLSFVLGGRGLKGGTDTSKLLRALTGRER